MPKKQSLLSRIFNPNPVQGQYLGQDMIPVNAHNEYRAPDEDSILDTELPINTVAAPEIDLNGKRTVAPHTFFAIS